MMEVGPKGSQRKRVNDPHLAYVDSGSIIAKVESPVLGLAYGLGRTHLGSLRTARKLDRKMAHRVAA
jgi:hypothetical protein